MALGLPTEIADAITEWTHLSRSRVSKPRPGLFKFIFKYFSGPQHHATYLPKKTPDLEE